MTAHDPDPTEPAARRRRAVGPVVAVVAASVLLSVLVVASQMRLLLRSRGSHAIGDGSDPSTYGFDLSTCLVDRGTLVGAGMPRDGLPVLIDPPTITPAEADEINRNERGKYLVPSDRVIGVEIGGDARAYPIRVMNWHEIANDVVGGVPIAVTYSPLCDSVVVFDRRVGGETLVFGVSGLLWNSNLLLYDRRRDAAGSSLWSQLQARAVAGPAAGRGLTLDVLPCQLVRWDAWRERHPDTVVLARDPALKDRYKRDPYRSYYGATDLLRFPVAPLPSSELPLAYKEPIAAIRIEDVWHPVPLAWVASEVDEAGRLSADLGGMPVVFAHEPLPPTMFVDTDRPLPAIHALWFAWHACRPDMAPVRPRPAGDPGRRP